MSCSDLPLSRVMQHREYEIKYAFLHIIFYYPVRILTLFLRFGLSYFLNKRITVLLKLLSSYMEWVILVSLLSKKLFKLSKYIFLKFLLLIKELLILFQQKYLILNKYAYSTWVHYIYLYIFLYLNSTFIKYVLLFINWSIIVS